MGVEEGLHQRQAGAHRVDVPGGERDRLGGGFLRHGAVLAQSGGRHKVPLRQIDGFPHPAGRARLGCPDLSPVVTRETVMPMHLEGSCRCVAVTFAPDSHTPVPYQLRSEEHTSELQSLMRLSYVVFCLQKTSYREIAAVKGIYSMHTPNQHIETRR